MREIFRIIFITIVVILLQGCGLINTEDGVVTIDEVLQSEEGSTYQIEGIVVSLTDKGILVQDDTGSIYVNLEEEHNYAIGNLLSITGTIETVKGSIQFKGSVEIAAISIDSYIESRTPEVLSPEDVDDSLSSYIVGDYIQVIGECSNSGEVVVLSFQGTETLVSVIMNDTESDFCEKDNTPLIVTGYIMNASSSVLNILYVSHQLVEVSFDDIDTQIIDVSEHTSIDWTTYVNNASSNVSDTFTFEADDTVDYDLPGEYEVTVTTTDGLGFQAAQSFTVIVNDPTVLINNGDFSSQDFGWSFNDGSVGGGSGTFTISNGVGAVTITSPVSEGWGPRLESNVIEFEQGETYIISFEVRADQERVIGLQLGELLLGPPWFNKYLDYRFLYYVGEYWNYYELEFVMNQQTGDGQLLFELGDLDSSLNSITTVYFDNVQIEKVDVTKKPPMIYGVYDLEMVVDFEIDPMEWITAYDYEDGDLTSEIEMIGNYDMYTPGVYGLTFRVTDSHGNITEESCTITLIEKDSISEVLNGTVGDFYRILGTVIAVKYNGFLVFDGSDYIYVFSGPYHYINIGDKVYVEGINSIYGGAVQFDLGTYFWPYDSEEFVEERTPEIHDGTSIEILRYDFAPGAYVQFTGTFEHSGDYFNVIIDGTTAIASLYPYSDSMDLTVYDGQIVTVTGYIIYFNGDLGQYLNIIVTEVVAE